MKKRPLPLSCVLVLALALFGAEQLSAQSLSAGQLLEIYRADKLPPVVSLSAKAELLKIAAALQDNDVDRAMGLWRTFWERHRIGLSAVERNVTLAWVLREAFLSSGKPLRDVLAAWEQEYRTPALQQTAMPKLQEAMNNEDKAIQMLSRIMQAQAEIIAGIIANLK